MRSSIWIQSASRLLMGLLILGGINVANAQSKFPFLGVVTRDHVRVRAGAGVAYYVVGTLAKGTVVHVDDMPFASWYKIIPPKGVYSYVSRAFVDARGDGKTGVVNKARVPVKSASINGPGPSYRRQLNLLKGDVVQIIAEEGGFYKIRPPKGAYVYLPAQDVKPAKFIPATSSLQKSSPNTTPQSSSGETSNHKPVKPLAHPVPTETRGTQRQSRAADQTVQSPATTNTKLPNKAVAAKSPVGMASPAPRPIRIRKPFVRSEAQPSLAAVPTPVAKLTKPSVPVMTVMTKPAKPKVPGDDVTAEVPRSEAASPVATSTRKGSPGAGQLQNNSTMLRFNAKSQALKEVEQRMIAAHQLPLDQRPFDALIQDYRKLLKIREMPIGDQRIIAARLAQLRRDAHLAAALKTITNAQGTLVVKALPKVPTPSTPHQNYDAVGELVASAVYDGKNLPLLYRLVNPANTRVTLHYVQPGDVLNPLKHLGKIVGIMGASKYDANLKLNILKPSRVDLMGGKAGL